MAAFIVANDGPMSGKKFPIVSPESVLGRHPECQIVVDVGAVSRKHARILTQGKRYFVEDLKSRNGTFLNDKMVQAREPLLPGDQVRVCDVTFTFHSGEPGEDLSGRQNTLAGKNLGTVVIDELPNDTSSVTQKLDVSTSRGRVMLSSSPEAKLSALIEINQNLGKALSLDEVLPTVLKSLFKIFVQADRGFIVMRRPDGAIVPMWTQVRREDSVDTIRISRTIVTQCMDSQQAILSADAATDERFEMSQSIADFRIRSMMCAPLVNSDGEAIGALQIDTLDQRKRFQLEDLEVLASVAGQAAIAIDNARMHDQALKQRDLERDLEVAHEVQRGFLPDTPPDNLSDYAFFRYYEPANKIGGDYYDYVQLPDGRVAILVADVVGHGVAAALLMAKLSAEARFSLAVEPDPARAVNRLNDALCRLPLDKFVTMIMVVLDPAKHEGVIVNAGHMAPLWLKADGSLEEPSEDFAGLPLGIVEGMTYNQASISLEPGDLLVLFTDGINECAGTNGKMYSIDRMREHLRHAEDRNPHHIGQRMIDDVRQFLGDGEQDDDMCLVCFSRLKPAPSTLAPEATDTDSEEDPPDKTR
ncbi:SpoIIE family protein phosphatase [Lignipirellula cremea]|uniref:Phosphoserine phosphatase RsbU n=1 Tax=Lignipirellula cremea TaxID=2528010 RepID=A0A518DWY0_9BACT|nr:SpoIIE family protein phosphatase [Lignipirellula cremea]QDU96342.1 Phosphoserine phosphatase RsbU [Lignipirellula cremea]